MSPEYYDQREAERLHADASATVGEASYDDGLAPRLLLEAAELAGADDALEEKARTLRERAGEGG